jgi:hypothetical protein
MRQLKTRAIPTGWRALLMLFIKSVLVCSAIALG